MTYQLFIFDLDGTLLNTIEDLKCSVNYALKQKGYPQRTLEEVRTFVGDGIEMLLKRSAPSACTPDDLSQLLLIFKDHYALHCADHTLPYEGITALLDHLQDKGCKIAVVSNKVDSAVKKLCLEYFGHRFDGVVGERANVRRKPAPDSVNEILQQLKIPREQAVYIGDSEVDIQTAINASMDCISVDWGYRDHLFLEQHHAQVLLSHPEDLLRFCP